MRWLAWMLGAVVLVGCGGNARIVRRDAYSGVLALEGRQDKARLAANRMMDEHCGERGHVVTLEEEVPVGSQVVYNRQSNGQVDANATYDGVDVDSRSRTTAVARSSTVGELRITYTCGGAPAPAPAIVEPVAATQPVGATQPPVPAAPQLIIVEGGTAGPPIVAPAPAVIVTPTN